jgi:hypothetical protein
MRFESKRGSIEKKNEKRTHFAIENSFLNCFLACPLALHFKDEM